MITEPEMAEDPDLPQAAGSAEDVVGAEDGRRRAGRPWPWMLGTAVATCAVGALVLHAVGYGQTRAPDLHGYHALSPCVGDNLKPLIDAIHPRTAPGTSAADEESGPATEALQCSVQADGPDVAQWAGQYQVTATVELHKDADPKQEFAQRTRAHAGVVDPMTSKGTVQNDSSVPVRGLGDEAFLVSHDSWQTELVVRHGGAVFTLDLTAVFEFKGSSFPVDANGNIEQPSMARFAPALEQSMGRIMAALAK